MGVPLNTILQVRFEHTANQQTLMNVIHYQNTAVSSAATIDAEYDELHTALTSGLNNNPNWTTRFRDCFGANVSIDGIVVQFVAPIRYVSKRLGLIGALGTNAADCTAQNVQASFLKTSSLAGKRNRGALRLGGLPEDFYDEGKINFAVANPDLSNFRLSMLANVTTAGGGTWRPGIVKLFPPPNTGQSTFVPQTGVTLMDTLRTQRSRTVGRGI